MMMSSDKVKEKWDYEIFSFEGDNSYGLTWPQKNYNCSFCKREFKSAQALGGHMNVHRRDRARLRLLSSPVLDPNTSFSSSSLSSPPSTFSIPFQPKPLLFPSLTSLSSSSPAFANEDKKRLLDCPRVDPCGSRTKKKNIRAVFGVEELKCYAQKSELDEVLNKGKVISLDLEMGLKDAKEVLDLELRLGYY